MYIPAIHIMLFKEEFLKCPSLICDGNNLILVRIFYSLRLHLCFIFFYFFRVIVTLKYSRFEGGITFFPPRMNTVLGVTWLSLLALLAPCLIFTFLWVKTQLLFLNLSFVRPTKAIRQILHTLTFISMRTASCSQLEHYFRSASY